MIYTSLFFCFLGLSVKKERGVNTSVIAPLFCPQSLDNLSESYYSDIDFQNGKIYFQKIGKLIMCTSMIQLTEPLNSGITNVGTVPEGFRPPKTVEIAVFGSAVERQADILGNIDIQSNGSMRLFSSQTFTSVAFRITACWFI